jgi:hypothetical protein
MTRRLPRFVPVIAWLGQADGGWNHTAVQRSAPSWRLCHAFGRVIRLENARRPATGDRRIWCPARDKQDCVALRPHTIQQDWRRHGELDPRRWGSVQVDGKGFKGDGTS